MSIILSLTSAVVIDNGAGVVAAADAEDNDGIGVVFTDDGAVYVVATG